MNALARVEPTPLPLLSLYLNTDIDASGHRNHGVFLRKELRHGVTAYAEHSPERESIEHDVARIESYVARELDTSTRGLALFACTGLDLFEAIQLHVPFDRNRLVVGDRLHLYPLARLVKGADTAANELVTLAKRTSASVRFIEDSALLAEVGGVGASLRYLS